jgi:hypothetical protein
MMVSTEMVQVVDILRTDLAEVMSRAVGAKLIQRRVISVADPIETRFWDDEMEIRLFRADSGENAF